MNETIEAKLKECGALTIGELHKMTDFLRSMTEAEARATLELLLFLNPKIERKK